MYKRGQIHLIFWLQFELPVYRNKHELPRDALTAFGIGVLPEKASATLRKLQQHTVLPAEYTSETSRLISWLASNNLRDRVWKPALIAAGISYRELKQTRHTFATTCLACGENPLWIARVIGHRNTEMIIRVYGKFIEDAHGKSDGLLLNALLEGTKRKKR